MKSQDPFGFVKALQVPKDKKTIDKVHKILFKNKIKRTGGWNTEKYKNYLLRFEKMKNPKLIGVLAFKGGKQQIVSTGVQQYIGVGKTKRDALKDAIKSVDMWK